MSNIDARGLPSYHSVALPLSNSSGIEARVLSLRTMTFRKDALAVMFTCGRYDHAGEWAYRVGLPAKSGVGGGLLAVVNRQLGVAVYSPKLDAKGNSVRGILACRELASRLGLHAFEFTNVGSSFVQSLFRRPLSGETYSDCFAPPTPSRDCNSLR